MSQSVTNDLPPVDSLAERLGIPEEFLTRYGQAIKKKLSEAAQRLRERPDGVDGIQQLLHLASTVVLRQEPTALGSALRMAAELISELKELTRKDPETLLTIAAVNFLLKWGREKGTPDSDLQLLRHTLDARHWLLGEDDAAKNALGIGPTESVD